MSSQPTPTHSKPFFSIVIPTLNEEKYLPLLLEDLSKQTFGTNNFEVIHVDGNSNDKTVEKAKKFAKTTKKSIKNNSKNSENNRLNLKSIVIKKRNVSTQRNRGAKKAKGEWIIFMDADNRLDDYFLDGIKYRLAKNPECDIFTVWAKTKNNNPKNQAIYKTVNFYLELYNNIGRPVAIGAMIGAKKSLTNKYKFDEKQLVYEDAFLVREAFNQGHNFQIFRDPTWYFSLRRLKKDGVLKIAGKVALLNLRFLQNKKFTDKNYGYDMEGGASYSEKSNSIIYDLRTYLKKASKKQLVQAKKLLQNLKELQV